MTDGMDQAKFRTPRVLGRHSALMLLGRIYRKGISKWLEAVRSLSKHLKMWPVSPGQFSKLYSMLFRPSLHVAAVWCHGAVLNFYIGDQCLKKDPDTQLEMVARTLSGVYREHRALALGISLHQDNCDCHSVWLCRLRLRSMHYDPSTYWRIRKDLALFRTVAQWSVWTAFLFLVTACTRSVLCCESTRGFREGKNQWVVQFMLLLVALKVYRWSVLNYLRTGHSSFLSLWQNHWDSRIDMGSTLNIIRWPSWVR